MGNPNDDAVAHLERDWPNWQIWYVRRLYGGPVWCARRHEDRDAVPARVLNADSPEHLAEALADEVTR